MLHEALPLRVSLDITGRAAEVIVGFVNGFCGGGGGWIGSDDGFPLYAFGCGKGGQDRFLVRRLKVLLQLLGLYVAAG